MSSYVLVTFLVTKDGDQGHPMDITVTRVDLTENGSADDASISRLVERIRREVLKAGGAR